MSLNPADFKTPAIRHLAWMLTAPQLLRTPWRFDPGSELSVDIITTLDDWDCHPAQRPEAFSRPMPRRLGIYFETLYEILMRDLLGWELIARNLPVRNSERTLGELDFLLRNPHSQRVEHHEIAVKFYLGHLDNPGQTRWYGPNSRDRLDIKTRRLLDHQSRLTDLPETRAELSRLGINQAITPAVYMPGYLFHPATPGAEPSGYVAEDHLRGRWLFAQQAQQAVSDNWVLLEKPHWLGPWAQPHPPDPQAAQSALAAVVARRSPRLFAIMGRDPDGQSWIERDRVFVVPAGWPGV